MSLRPLFAGIEALSGPLDNGTALLTPNRRLSRAVLQAQTHWRIARGERVWDSSAIMPLRQFWMERWNHAVTRGLLAPVTVLDASAQRLLWRRVIDSDEQLGFSLLSPGRAANLCQEAAERLALWRIDLSAPAVRQTFSFDDDARAFLRWEQRFRDALAELSAMTSEQALEQLLDCPDALDTPVALLHIEDLAPLHRALCENSPAYIHVEAPAVPAAQVAPVRVFTEPRAELQAAARWCREQVTTDPQGRYAVVLADMQNDRHQLEYYLRREFDCLTSDYESLPVNFATGFMLDTVPLVRDALRILALSAPQVDIEDAVALLHSRFVAPLELRVDQRERCVQKLRELAREQVPQGVLQAVFEELIAPDAPKAPWIAVAEHVVRERLHHRDRLPSQWLEPLGQILGAWGWPLGVALDSLEYQQSVSWQEALEDFATLDPLTGPVDFAHATQLLRERLGETQFQPRTDDQAVQVLGPLETTGLNFDALWITGMSAAQWPAAAQPNPYLPHRLQRESGMPHADANWEWHRARSRWQDWVRGAAQLQPSYVCQADGTDALPSPLLADLEFCSEEESFTVDARWQRQRDTAEFEPVHMEPEPLIGDERAAAGVGAGVLEQQSLCPFQAFAATRLNAAPDPGVSAGLLPTERGSLLHRALYSLWGVLSDGATLRAQDDSAIGKLLDSALDYAERGIPRARADVLGGDILGLERKRLAALLRQWMALEMTRSVDFVVTGREEPRQYRLGDLLLNLRLDRVDQFSDGSTLIIDYKSSVPATLSAWFRERPTQTQLPLYALLDPPAAGIAYASLKPGKLGFRGVGDQPLVDGLDSPQKYVDESQTADMATLRSHWHRELTALAAEFLRGENRVEPTADACRYCQRFSLCRLSEELA